VSTQSRPWFTAFCDQRKPAEIAINVACDAGNLGVLSQQRILGFRVIEIKARQHRFPPTGGMATGASFF
jgi:hypothetical protein